VSPDRIGRVPLRRAPSPAATTWGPYCDALHPPRRVHFIIDWQNVEISRARCLAYLVCTEGLPTSRRARDVSEIRLIATLCEFVAWSQRSR
jgi:hypothetical protein